MTNQQDIVPVQLKDDYKKKHQCGVYRNSHKLVERLKCATSELNTNETG